MAGEEAGSAGYITAEHREIAHGRNRQGQAKFTNGDRRLMESYGVAFESLHALESGVP